MGISKITRNFQIIWETAGMWSNFKETGIEYERRVRRGWKKRKAE